MDLISNHEYSLSQLFSTPGRRIIIPDFQRDYCWGDKTHGEKQDTDILSNFLDTVIDEFNSNQNADLLLGKIDVYEHPKDHVYLTDGQQRLTSLYLLLGMLYRNKVHTQKDPIKRCLVSDFEENQTDKEPYLKYAVRESTVFFLKDLVNEFFLKNNNLKVSDIKKQPWYFSEYNLDPSIISMLSALNIIEKKQREIDIDGFSEFIINNIKIQYYDVHDKKHGEERFVIINTTGKSLTVSENIKPILLANSTNIEKSNQWEERETYFWKNRKSKESIADDGVNDFLTWSFQIIDKQDEVDIIKKAKQLLKESKNLNYLPKIHIFFESLLQLIEWCKEECFQQQFKFINDNREVKNIVDFRDFTKEVRQNVLFPLISFISKFQDDKGSTLRLLRRLRKNFFDLKWNDRKHNYLDWRYILEIIEKSNSIHEILQFETNENTISKIQNIHLNNWFNDEEKIKINFSNYREDIEKWEDHQDFMGDLTFLFQVSFIANDSTEIPKIEFEVPVDFEKLNGIFHNYQSTVDLIRNQQTAEKDTDLANMFRLFRLFIGCNKVGHIYRACWDFEGVLFSTLNREHLNKVDFMKLVNATDLLSFCTTFIKNRIHEEDIFNLENFTAEKFIKAWLTLKVFYANDKNELLVFYDGNETGVAAYTDNRNNDLKLISTEEFSLSNAICGFGVRSGFGSGNYVHYTNEDLWCKPNIIDTPFSDVAHKKEHRTLEQVKKNSETIEYIINSLIRS